MSSLGVRRRFAAVSLALAGSLVALSACSGADDPDADAAQSPSSSVSPSASPTPTPTPSATYKPASAEGPAENVPLPVMPEEAKVESKEGLIAFARYWYELINYGYETGDVEPVKAVSGPDCFACQSFYEVVQSGFQDSDWMAGAGIEVQGADSSFARTDEGYVQVLVQLVQEPLEYYGPAGVQAIEPGNELPSVQMIEAEFGPSGWSAIDVVTIHASKK
ncbi:hypothetical protein GCM10009688_24260 [Arthrobacter gandavensis]|uniref:DUF6318 domain-containing protein n=1 Tax=Arthrobacter gandavensis TaxID=169960 RepID=A0ABN2PE58_9MICC|nr:DUF6318 family protein [Arthrobacter citreus]